MALEKVTEITANRKGVEKGERFPVLGSTGCQPVVVGSLPATPTVAQEFRAVNVQ